MAASNKFSFTFIFLLIIFTIPGVNLLAQGTNQQQVFEPQGMASSMGKISTVSTDGPYDVLRNPAILTTQKEDNAAVIGISREAYSSFNISIDADINMISQSNMAFSGISFSSDFSRELYMNSALAYSRKITENIFAGLAVTGNIETMENKNSSTITITSPDLPNDLQLYSDTEETEKNRTTNMVFSAGYKFLNNYSVGFQTKAEYIKNDKSGIEESFSPYEASRTKTKSSNESISPIIGFGFLYKDILQEAGLLITSGKHMWKKTGNEMQYHDSINPSNDYELKNNKLKKGKYIESPGIIAGYYIQLIPLIGLAAEAGCILPLKYKEHTLKYLTEERNYFDAETKVEKKFTFMINGGIKLNPYKDITAALGGGYRIITNESTSTEFSILHQKSREKSDIKFTGYLGTLGLENKVLSGSKIIISMDLIYLKISSGGTGETDKSYPNDTASMDMKMKQKVGGFFFNTGMAYVQYF